MQKSLLLTCWYLKLEWSARNLALSDVVSLNQWQVSNNDVRVNLQSRKKLNKFSQILARLNWPMLRNYPIVKYFSSFCTFFYNM